MWIDIDLATAAAALIAGVFVANWAVTRVLLGLHSKADDERCRRFATKDELRDALSDLKDEHGKVLHRIEKNAARTNVIVRAMAHKMGLNGDVLGPEE